MLGPENKHEVMFLNKGQNYRVQFFTYSHKIPQKSIKFHGFITNVLNTQS